LVNRRRLLVLAAVAALAGCAGQPAAPAPAAPAASVVFNDTDVMFLQMSLEHARQGAPVASLAADRATSTEVRALAAELRTQWAAESGTMTGWLTGWDRPLTAADGAGVHAGHGDLHSLRESDVAELRAASGAEFDRTALSLLLGHLHNSVEVTRLETTAGGYPPAKELAETMTRTRLAQIQRMLTLLA
jgi:uncharacterized protein (DUF305 family)